MQKGKVQREKTNGDRIYHNEDLIENISNHSYENKSTNRSLLCNPVTDNNNIVETPYYNNSVTQQYNTTQVAQSETHKFSLNDDTLFNNKLDNYTKSDCEVYNLTNNQKERQRQKRCHVSIDKLLLTARNSTSPLAKRLALDYYIKHNIIDIESNNNKTTGECGCCFEHNSLNRENLLNELDECYKKLYSNSNLENIHDYERNNSKHITNIDSNINVRTATTTKTKTKTKKRRRQVRRKQQQKHNIVLDNLAASESSGSLSSCEILFDIGGRGGIKRDCVYLTSKQRKTYCQKVHSNINNNKSSLFKDRIDNNDNNKVNANEEEEIKFVENFQIQADTCRLSSSSSWAGFDFNSNQVNILKKKSSSSLILNPTYRRNCSSYCFIEGAYKQHKQGEEDRTEKECDADAEESYCDEEEDEVEERGNALASISDSISDHLNNIIINNNKTNGFDGVPTNPSNLAPASALDNLKLGSNNTFQTTTLEHCSLTDDSTLSLSCLLEEAKLNNKNNNKINKTTKEELKSFLLFHDYKDNHNHLGPSNQFIKKNLNIKKYRKYSLDENYFLKNNNVSLDEYYSMRSRVKDIAKMSVPSLASLQYLPNQMDASNKIKKRFKSESPTSLNANKIDNSNQMEDSKSNMTITKQATISSGNNIKVINESKEEIYHDDSLLHRLCLCNCISRNPNQHYKNNVDNNSKQQRSESSSPNESSSIKKNSKSVKRSKSSRSFLSSGDSRSTSPIDEFSSSMSTKSDRKIKNYTNLTGEEKQSPSFLNLLKSSSPMPQAQKQKQHKNNVDGEELSFRQQSKSHKSSILKKQQREAKFKQQHPSKALNATFSDENLGSAGDLEIASASCSSRNEETSEDNNNDSNSSLRFRSSSFNTNSKNTFVTNSLAAKKSKFFNDNKQRPQSACSNRNNEEDDEEDYGKINKSSSSITKSNKGYRKYLSPGRLFGSDKTSSSKSGNDLLATTSDEYEHNITSKPNKSFFSRSLNRLSSRSPKRAKIDERENLSTLERKTEEALINSEATDQLSELNNPVNSTSCASPTISISTASLKDLNSSLEDFNNDNIHYNNSAKISNKKLLGNDKSRLFVGPEIVINRVKYFKHNSRDRASSDLTEESCDMTRSKSYKYKSRYRQQQQQQGAFNNTYNDDGEQQQNSYQQPYNDFSEYTSDNWSDRAFSLPASPRSSRRGTYNDSHSEITSFRSRSPRLRESPIPFRSPATPSTRIEDGLKVCSTEHFEKHIGNIKDNQIETQKRLFKAWINHFCPNLIIYDLIDELKDGIKLIGLLAELTGDKKLLKEYDRLKRDKQSYVNRLAITPSSRLRNLSNVSVAINYLRQNLNMKLINLNPMDIVSGKANVILGLCWNIILNFQLEQNFLKYLEDSCSNINENDSLKSESSSTKSVSLLSNQRNEEEKSFTNTKIKNNRSINQTDEYSMNDIILARKKLLDHINKRFNLTLTNLTSNLLDGDVLLTIIKRLIPSSKISVEDNQHQKEKFFLTNSEGIYWKNMSDNEKLDHCFNLANTYLNVPRLFSASDLKQQLINNSDNISKPLLVYLSMLLSSGSKESINKAAINNNDSSTILKQVNNLSNSNKLNNTKQKTSSNNNDDHSITDNIIIEEKNIDKFIEKIDTSDKFDIDKMKSTILSVKELEKLIYENDNNIKSSNNCLDKDTLKRFENLKKQVNQVEDLINWINEADNLFETKQKCPNDLINSIKIYQDFFSIDNVPQIQTFICSTLERQYRECLANANQRLHFMEQSLKNWQSYEESRKQLKDWLILAEQKLTDSLIEEPTQISNNLEQIETANLIEKNENIYSNKKLIDNEQLTKVHTERLEDLIEFFELEPSDLSNYSDYQPNFLLPDDSISISGSISSLISNTSRKSALQLSKKAKYTKLFEDFELKCRLLAAMLDSDQRNALLFGVKELKIRLKYIIEQRVPQVICESKMSLERCKQYINDQQTNVIDENYQLYEDKEEVDLEEDTEETEDLISDSPLEIEQDLVSNSLNQSSINTDDQQKQQQEKQSEQSSKLDKKARKKQLQLEQQQRKQQKGNKSSLNKNKKKSQKGSNSNKRKFKVNSETNDEDKTDLTISTLIWRKIVRAFRASFSLNIVLLICLAGICVVPLVHKDACCELTQENIPTEKINFNEKPI